MINNKLLTNFVGGAMCSFFAMMAYVISDAFRENDPRLHDFMVVMCFVAGFLYTDLVRHHATMDVQNRDGTNNEDGSQIYVFYQGKKRPLEKINELVNPKSHAFTGQGKPLSKPSFWHSLWRDDKSPEKHPTKEDIACHYEKLHIKSMR